MSGSPSADQKKLGISGVLVEAYSWFTRAKDDEGQEHHGAQIDLVLERRDHVTNLCEIKYSLNQYEIDKEYDMNLRNKIEAFRKSTGTRNTLQITMITTYGIKRNKYSNLIGSEVLLEDLFAEAE